MSYALKTKLRRLTAALTAFVLAFSLAPATAFADWGSFSLTGSIEVSGVDSASHNIYVYQVAETQVNSDSNATQWVAVDSNGDTSTSGTSYNAIASWIANNSNTNANTLGDLVESGNLGTLVASWVDGDADTGTIGFSTSGTTTTATVSNLDPGIYVVLVENNDSVTASSTYYNYTYQTIVASVNVEADDDSQAGAYDWKIATSEAIALKSFVSSVSKEIVAGNNVDYYTSGNELTFMVTVEIPSGNVDYFYVEDLLTGLEYTTGSLAIYSSEPEVDTSGAVTNNPTEVSSGYTLYTDNDAHGTAVSSHSFNTESPASNQEVLHVDFDLSALAGQTVYMIYKAKITDDGIANGSYNEVTSSAIVDGGNDDPDGGDEVVVSYALTIFAYYLDDTSQEVGLNDVVFSVYATTAPTYSGGSWTGGGTVIYSGLTTATDSTKGAGYVSTSSASSTYGLVAGKTYYIVETKVPSAYVLPTTAQAFILTLTDAGTYVGKDSDGSDLGTYSATDNMLTVSIPQTASNEQGGGGGGTGGGDGTGINLPVTGGLGTILLTAVGVLIIAAGACYTLRSRKQQQRRQQG